MASTEELRLLLEPTSLPEGLIEEFFAETNALWLMGERADVVAGEVVLCHPPLEDDEVRAVVKPTDTPGRWRITVVTADRSGLVAATAGVLASHGLSITCAAVTVLGTSRLALQRIMVEAADPSADAMWDDLGGRLREVLGGGEPVRVQWKPTQPVSVTCHPQGTGRVMVQIQAPDSAGLLWAAARAISAGGGNIEAARLGSQDGLADGVLIIDGPVDGVALADTLSEGDVVELSTLGQLLTAPLAAGAFSLRRGADLLGRKGAAATRRA